jgi:hypothetical protein
MNRIDDHQDTRAASTHRTPDNQTAGHSHSAGHGAPPPAEPTTPLWLPALGAALFVAVGLVWAASPAPGVSPDAAAGPDGGANATGDAAVLPPH